MTINIKLNGNNDSLKLFDSLGVYFSCFILAESPSSVNHILYNSPPKLLFSIYIVTPVERGVFSIFTSFSIGILVIIFCSFAVSIATIPPLFFANIHRRHNLGDKRKEGYGKSYFKNHSELGLGDQWTYTAT